MAKKPTAADQQKIKALLEEAKRLYFAKDFDSTIKTANEVLALNPNDKDHAEALTTRGAAKNQLGQYAEAIEGFDKAIKLNPENDWTWNGLGYAKNNLGQHVEAIEDYTKAIGINPENDAAWNNRGYAKDNLGQHTEAIEDLNEAIKLKPEDAVAWNNRGSAKDNLGQHAEAIEDLNEAIRLNPEYAVAWNNRGHAKNSLGQHDDAIADYTEAIRLNPEYASAWNNRGNVKVNLGDFKGALGDLDEAIQLDPGNAQFINNRAAIKAGHDARKAIGDRIGSLDDTDDDIDDIIEELKEDYKKARTQRDNIAVTIVGIIIILSSVFLGGFGLNATTLHAWAIASVSISVPLFIFLRLISRDAEELKILRFDYLRMKAIEARINVYQSIMSDEERVRIIEKQIDNWTHNSPSATLLRLKGKRADTAVNHPAESMIEKCTDMMGKGKPPNNPAP